MRDFLRRCSADVRHHRALRRHASPMHAHPDFDRMMGVHYSVVKTIVGFQFHASCLEDLKCLYSTRRRECCGLFVKHPVSYTRHDQAHSIRRPHARLFLPVLILHRALNQSLSIPGEQGLH